MTHDVQVHPPAKLSEITEHRMNLYSLGAVAAGVSLLALAQPAEGRIVVTQANITVTSSSPAFIDLNGDGKQDFEFAISVGGYDHSFYRTLAVIPLTGGKVVGGARAALGPYGSALASGANIGATAWFSSSVARGQVTLERTNGTISFSTHYTPYGPWGVKGTPHYLGVKFLISGATYYGWINIEVDRPGVLEAYISEYAYNTVAGQKISAGQTADDAELASSSQTQENKSLVTGPSLGMLAAGVDGLRFWRQQRPQANSKPIISLTAGE